MKLRLRVFWYDKDHAKLITGRLWWKKEALLEYRSSLDIDKAPSGSGWYYKDTAIRASGDLQKYLNYASTKRGVEQALSEEYAAAQLERDQWRRPGPTPKVDPNTPWEGDFWGIGTL